MTSLHSNSSDYLEKGGTPDLLQVNVLHGP